MCASSLFENYPEQINSYEQHQSIYSRREVFPWTCHYSGAVMHCPKTYCQACSSPISVMTADSGCQSGRAGRGPGCSQSSCTQPFHYQWHTVSLALGLLLGLRGDVVLLVPVFALLLTWPCKKQPLFPAVLILRTSFLALSIRSSSVTACLDSLFGEPLAEQSPRSFLSVTLAVPPSHFGEP